MTNEKPGGKPDEKSAAAPVVVLRGVGLSYGPVRALDGLDLDLPAGRTVGFIGPDGVGKSSLLALISGARAVAEGTVEVLGGDMARKSHRDRVGPSIAYMPQGLGKNLYPMLSVEENLQFFARLFGHSAAERRRRIDDLTRSTGLHPFLDRPAGKLSGGMKQKLGLCGALIHDPRLLILDEPTTGVDPLARSQFWDLIDRVRREQTGMSVLVATAYMDEAERFDWLVAMDGGRVLDTGSPRELLAKTGSESLEEAFIKLLPPEKREGYEPVEIKPLAPDGDEQAAIEARDLTKKFGGFTAVDHVSFRIRKGEIFGFLGSNGSGKSTTMKMLTGLLPVSSGQAWLFGREVDSDDMATRRNVGYMSQAFSLYNELTVRQNLVLHARLFHVPEEEIPGRVEEISRRFELTKIQESLPESLPLGVRQRLSLAVALVHRPSLLILDEPTSGVDPVARDNFWRLMITISRRDRVTIFISTHFMNEAERCDRISFMHAGKVLDSDTPQKLVEKSGAENLEAAFIKYLREAGDGAAPEGEPAPSGAPAGAAREAEEKIRRRFDPGRLLSYTWRETLELKRDPVRTTLALLGSLILMLVIGFGINMDVNELSFAVLDRDQSGLSQNYVLNISGSRYFLEQEPLIDYQDVDRRLRSGQISLALEIPPGFGRDLQRGAPVEIAAWIDGAMPQRAETIAGYVQGMHQQWLMEKSAERTGALPASLTDIQIRFRYNPDVESLPAMVPAVIPILLLMLPSMLAALSVVREKELGSIINLYVTPVTRSEFLLGKQIPYLVLAMLNYLLMALMSVTLFGVPVKGDFFTLTLGAFLYCLIATGIGLLASTFTRSQIAAMFITMIGTMMPAIQFSGMINPTSSLEGVGRLVGDLYPTTHMLVISRGVFNKALGFADLHSSLAVLALTFPLILALSVALLKKQET